MNRNKKSKKRNQIPKQPPAKSTSKINLGENELKLALARPKLSLGKKVLFSFLVFCIFFGLFELSLSLIGLKPALYEEDPYVGFSSYIPLFVKAKAPDGTDKMVTANNKIKYFNPQQFPAKKSLGTYRIFCLGGSTTFGRPYLDLTSFCGWLREMLPKADPSHKWEVINAGGISYASYRDALLMEELKNYSPDMFIVYGSQNDFLEKRTYGKIIDTPSAVHGIGAMAARTRTYSAVKKVIDTFSKKNIKNDTKTEPKSLLKSEVYTILENSVGPEDYQRNDQLTQQILSHFRYNIARMDDIAKSCNAEILYIAQASNLRSCQPFKSDHRSDLTEPQIRQFMQLFETAKQDYAAGKLDKALADVEQALKIDNRYAHLLYLQGQILWDLKQWPQAKAAFVKSMDEDVCPLRALTPMRKIIAEVAAERKAMFIDFVAMNEQLADHGVPGDDLFLDHVHPTIDMHKKLALTILDKMKERGIVKLSPDWSQETINQITKDVQSKIDPKIHGSALRNLSQLLRWAGKFDESQKLAKKATEMLSGDAESYYLLAGDVADIPDKELPAAIENLKKSLQVDPDYVMALHALGIALSRLGDLDEAVKPFEHALKIEPQNSLIHNSLGNLYQMKGDLDAAIDHFKKSIEASPDFATGYSNLANIYVLKQDYPQAIDYYEKSLTLRPNVVKIHYNVGGLYDLQGNKDKALEHFYKALKIDPDYGKANLMIGNIFQNKGEYKKAVEYYLKTLKTDPQLPITYYRLYEMYTQTNQLDLADKYLSLYQQAESKQGVNERGY